MHSSLFLDKSHMAFFNLLYHIYDVRVYQCKSNKHKAAFQLRLQTHRSRAGPTSGSHSQLSPRRSHFLFLAMMLKMHGLNHQRKERNHHHIYYEFQHHSKNEHRKKDLPPEAARSDHLGKELLIAP